MLDFVTNVLYKMFHDDQICVQKIAREVQSLWTEHNNSAVYKTPRSLFDSIIDEANCCYNDKLSYVLPLNCNLFLLFKKLNCFNDHFEACAVSAFMKKYYNDIVEEL